jgi:hypothetical protein
MRTNNLRFAVHSPRICGFSALFSKAPRRRPKYAGKQRDLGQEQTEYAKTEDEKLIFALFFAPCGFEISQFALFSLQNDVTSLPVIALLFP